MRILFRIKKQHRFLIFLVTMATTTNPTSTDDKRHGYTTVIARGSYDFSKACAEGVLDYEMVNKFCRQNEYDEKKRLEVSTRLAKMVDLYGTDGFGQKPLNMSTTEYWLGHLVS